MKKFREKSKKLRIALFFCICLSCVTVSLHAGQITDTEPDTGSVTAEYKHGKTVLADMEVELYQVAEMDRSGKDVSFTVNSDFSECISQIKTEQNYTSAEWGSIAVQLADHVANTGLTGQSSQKTDKKGRAAFENLEPGLYLLISDGTDDYQTSPVLCSVPYNTIEITGRNELLYNIVICAKVEERKQPDVPDVPKDPEDTEKPRDPVPPKEPVDPKEPEEPQEPKIPERPDVPERPQDPEVPSGPINPENPIPQRIPENPNRQRKPASDVPEEPEGISLTDMAETMAPQQTVRIGSAEVPLFAGGGAAWALINFMLMNLAVFLSLMLLIGYFVTTKKADEEEDEDKDSLEESTKKKRTVKTDEEEEEESRKLKKKGLIRILSIPFAIISVITFILTEDISLPTALLDKWTLLMLLYVLIQMIWVVFSRKKYAGKEEEEEEKEA